MLCRSLSLSLFSTLLIAALGACATAPAPRHAQHGFYVSENTAASATPIAAHGAAGSLQEAPVSPTTDGANAGAGTGAGTGAQDDTAVVKEPPPPTTIREAIEQGSAYIKLRVRAETVKQSGFSKDANAVTARTVLGYETATIFGFSALVEAENVSRLSGKTYNDTTNGKTDRPVVADPTGTEVNQAYLQYVYDDLMLRGGRQRIILDNARFVGNVGWRQNEQTFDAVSAKGKLGEVDLYASYIGNVNRIFGEDHPMGDSRMDSWLFNAKAPIGERTSVTGYWYYLDYRDSSDMTALSTSTLGGFFNGGFGGEEKPLVNVYVEFARQEDIGSNDTRVRADYSHYKVTGDAGPVTLGAGYETLDGSRSGNGAFNTPLATLHKFNGWADKFLTTPGTGLEDSYLSVGGKVEGTSLLAVYHDFRSEASSRHYGNELDLRATRPINEYSSWGAKYADYNADNFSKNTRKVWLWYETHF
jgi:hypothetical protein